MGAHHTRTRNRQYATPPCTGRLQSQRNWHQTLASACFPGRKCISAPASAASRLRSQRGVAPAQGVHSAIAPDSATTPAGPSGSLFSTQVDSSPGAKWSADVVAGALKTKYPGTKWLEVFAALDHEEFLILDEPALHALVAVWREVATGPFPIAVFIDKLWTNVQGQLSFLRFAVLQVRDLAARLVSCAPSPALQGRQWGWSC